MVNGTHTIHGAIQILTDLQADTMQNRSFSFSFQESFSCSIRSAAIYGASRTPCCRIQGPADGSGSGNILK